MSKIISQEIVLINTTVKIGLAKNDDYEGLEQVSKEEHFSKQTVDM